MNYNQSYGKGRSDLWAATSRGITDLGGLHGLLLDIYDIATAPASNGRLTRACRIQRHCLLAKISDHEEFIE